MIIPFSDDVYYGGVVIAEVVIPVSVGEKQHPKRKTRGQISFQSAKSGGGQQVLLQDCRAKAAI